MVNDKRLYNFLQLDIKDCYLSIKETLSHKVIQFITEHLLITRKDVKEISTHENQFYIMMEGLR